MQRKSHNGSKRVALWAENPHSLKLRCGYGAERARQRSFKPRSEFNFLFRDTAGFLDGFDWERNTKLISVLDTHLLWHFPPIHAITKNMQEPFYKNGLKFTCKRCSFCCGHSPGFVYLSKSDLERLCAYFKMTAPDFAQKYCRWANYYHGTTVLALQEQKNYDCILWKDGCTAYQARPLQCSTYPFWSWMVQDKATWDEVAKDCPGMNSGQLWPKDYIDKTITAYDQNTPITKEQFDTLYSA